MLFKKYTYNTIFAIPECKTILDCIQNNNSFNNFTIKIAI